MFLTASCGKNSTESGKSEVTVEFWHAMGAASHQDLLRRFAADYMASHPGIRIEPVFQGTYGSLYQKLIAAITARHPPAMAQMFESWTTRLYYRGRLDPVENYVSGPNGYSPEQLADFFPAFLEDSRWDGKLVTLPFSKSAFLLQYNADLLARAGETGPPKTWEDLRRAAVAISNLKTEDGRPCIGLQLRAQLESFTSFFFAADGRFLDEHDSPLMTSPAAERSLAYIDDLIRQDHGAIADSNYPAQRFGSGSVGMFIYSSASFPFNDRFSAGKFRWGAAPVPAPTEAEAANRKTLFQGMNVGILSGCAPEVRAAAWDFMKFMLEPERVAAWSMLTGYCPVRRSAVELPEMRDYLKRQPNYGVPIAEVDHAEFEPKPDFWESWRAGVGNEVTAALQGVKPPAEALEAAQREGEDSIRYDSKFPSKEGKRLVDLSVN